MAIGAGPIGAGPIAGVLSAGLGSEVSLADGVALAEATTFVRTHMLTLADTARTETFLDAVNGYAVSATDTAALASTLAASYGVVVRERLRFAETIIDNQLTHEALADAIQLIEALYVARDLVLVEGIGVAAVELIQRSVAILEELQLTPTLVGAARYNMTVSQLLRMADSVANFFGADVVEGVGVAESLVARQLALGTLADTIGMEPIIAPQMLVSATTTEGIGLEDIDVLQMLFNPTLVEGVNISAGYLAPDGSLTTWVMNTRSGAVTEYQNYNFTSFAQLGNRYIATSDEGLYELLGDDDDGTSITARIKSGYMQFGGTKLSRLSAAFIAATGEGELVLKIITKEGDEYIYQTGTRDGRSTRVHMGKGQRSRYFAFELSSLGHDFDIDTLEFVPVVVQRRV